MKKILLLLIITFILYGQDLSFTNDSWRSKDAINKFRFTYNIGINTPMHAFGEKSFIINENFEFVCGVVISSENDVGATLERPDFPLFSTGRFYQSELKYHKDNFSVDFGRHLDDQDPIRQNSTWNKKRLTGD
ncbi:hypothetical protein KA005_30950, partial [bacterium]|nr:hypothetical protein [bacterium]